MGGHTVGHRRNWRSRTEPDRSALPPLKSTLYFVFLARYLLSFASFIHRSAIPSDSALSERLVLVGGRNIGRGKRPARHCGTWRNPSDPDGTNGTPSGGINCALKSTIYFRFLRFFSSRPLPSAFPKTQRFGGFETPGIGWALEYRGGVSGQRG